VTITAVELPRRSSLARRSARHARRPQIAFGVVVALAWFVVLVTIQWWAPYDPLVNTGKRLLSPNAKHWLGTDTLGRDVFTRVLYGARQSLPIAVAVIIAAVMIGVVVGAVAGYVGGWLDAIMMRAADIVMAFPPIFLAMAVAAALGPGLTHAFWAIVMVWWPIYARLVRAQVLSIKNREHIDAAVTIGASRGRVLRKHVLPLALTPVLVNATMDLGQVVLLTASLSFLGLGAVPPSPEWGAMITEGAKDFYQWWIAVAPGLAMLTVVLGFNFLGDGLRDLFDTRAATR
jgi:peptide/nickel transport system permease protein